MRQLPMWVLILAAAITLAGCDAGGKVPDTSSFSDPPTTQAAPPSSASSAAPSAEWENSASNDASAPSAPPATTSDAAQPTQDQQQGSAQPGMIKCGKVSAGSGKTFDVQASEDVGCTTGKQVVKAFAEKVSSQQADSPGKPASAAINGFTCVSGPAAGGGGSVCSKGSSSILGAVDEGSE